MSEKPSNERLAAMEAKMEILLELLKEIRTDLKNNPSKEEFNVLQDRVKELETTQSKSNIKMASTSGAVSVVVSIIVAIIVKLLTH